MTVADPSARRPSQGASCRNCGARGEGLFCADCGQARNQTDRVSQLAAEWLQRMFGAEAILWSTLRQLVLNPGTVTQEWWAGRRQTVMSPVRTLFVVLLGGSLAAFLQQHLLGMGHSWLAGVTMAFVYQASVVMAVLSTTLLPLLLPGRLRRTTYENVTFALYASASLGVLGLAIVVAFVLGGAGPDWLDPFTGSLAAMLVPVVLAGALLNFVAHLRGAYELSWLGAAARTALLAVPALVGMLIVSFIAGATGLENLWASHFQEPPATARGR